MFNLIIASVVPGVQEEVTITTSDGHVIPGSEACSRYLRIGLGLAMELHYILVLVVAGSNWGDVTEQHVIVYKLGYVLIP